MQLELKRVEQARLRRDKAEKDLVDSIVAARLADLTLREIAEVAGITHETVRKYGADPVIAARTLKERQERARRDTSIRRARNRGDTLQSIAKSHGVTRERVRQVVNA